LETVLRSQYHGYKAPVKKQQDQKRFPTLNEKTDKPGAVICKTATMVMHVKNFSKLPTGLQESALALS